MLRFHHLNVSVVVLYSQAVGEALRHLCWPICSPVVRLALVSRRRPPHAHLPRVQRSLSLTARSPGGIETNTGAGWGGEAGEALSTTFFHVGNRRGLLTGARTLRGFSAGFALGDPWVDRVREEARTAAPPGL